MNQREEFEEWHKVVRSSLYEGKGCANNRAAAFVCTMNDWETWQAAQAKQAAEIERLKVELDAEKEELFKAMADAAPSVQGDWIRHAEQIVKYRFCMSYDKSYFGEPSGLLKRVCKELDLLIPLGAKTTGDNTDDDDDLTVAYMTGLHSKPRIRAECIEEIRELPRIFSNGEVLSRGVWVRMDDVIEALEKYK